MPGIEILALIDEAVGAGRRKPFDIADPRRRQLDAVRHFGFAAGIIRTAAGLFLEQTADDVGEVNLAGILILKLDQTTAAAAVAQRFPFAFGHIFQALFPERLDRQRLGRRFDRLGRYL
jgi:hypothetical protein